MSYNCRMAGHVVCMIYVGYQNELDIEAKSQIGIYTVLCSNGSYKTSLCKYL
jgi:hypothetical protein